MNQQPSLFESTPPAQGEEFSARQLALIDNAVDALMDRGFGYGEAYEQASARYGFIASHAAANESVSSQPLAMPKSLLLNGLVEADQAVPLAMDRRLHVRQTLRSLELLGEVSKRRAMTTMGAQISLERRYGSAEVAGRVARAAANANTMQEQAAAAYALSHNEIAFGGLTQAVTPGWRRFNAQYGGPEGRDARDEYKKVVNRIAREQGIPLPTKTKSSAKK